MYHKPGCRYVPPRSEVFHVANQRIGVGPPLALRFAVLRLTPGQGVKELLTLSFGRDPAHGTGQEGTACKKVQPASSY